MAGKLEGKKMAVLITNGCEEFDVTEPRAAFLAASAIVVIVSPEDARVAAWRDDKWLNKFEVVRDGNLVSSRHPADISEFNPAAIQLFAGFS